jgi:hypothetical protein
MLTSRDQLLDIARGVERMHKLDVVHGNLKAVCPFLHLHFVQALTLLKKNVLVDTSGNAYVAGLGMAFHPFNMPGGGIDWYFHGLAPELANPSLPTLLSLPTTKKGDVYAFGILALEVSPTFECHMGERLNGAGVFLRFSLSNHRSPGGPEGLL